MSNCLLVVATFFVGLLSTLREAHGWTNIMPNPLQPSKKADLVPPSNVKILILPGFGNDQKDYFLDDSPEGSLVRSLQLRGWGDDVGATDDDNSNSDESNKKTNNNQQVHVLPVERSDWLQVFTKGALDLDFWKNQAPATNPAFSWYLDLITREIQTITTRDTDRVVLLGHSAGGWLARACLGYCSSSTESDATSTTTTSFPLDKVIGLVTLGTPHLPPPPQVMDMTRGALRLTHETFPGTFHAQDGLFYLTVMGNAVQGVEQERTAPWEPTTVAGFAYESYSQVCGDGAAVGDGVVPQCAGHLTGAQQLDLPGVLHSINAPAQWYGSNSVLDQWHTAMLEEIVRANPNKEESPAASWISQLLYRQ